MTSCGDGVKFLKEITTHFEGLNLTNFHIKGVMTE